MILGQLSFLQIAEMTVARFFYFIGSIQMSCRRLTGISLEDIIELY